MPTILVVDDDPGIRNALTSVLEEEGYCTIEASNGREALQHLNEGLQPCLILLDLMMPVMSGWDFLDERANSASLSAVPVVVISASPTGSHAGRTRGCITKPLGIVQLLAVVERECPRG